MSRLYLEISPSSVTVSYNTLHLQSDLWFSHALPLANSQDLEGIAVISTFFISPQPFKDGSLTCGFGHTIVTLESQ